MSLLIESEVRSRAQQELSKSFIRKSYAAVLTESLGAFSELTSYDIFLSHSSKDAELIYGVKNILEDNGYRVYVDWVDDPQLDRSSVTRETANMLRHRMKVSKSLFYVTTDNALNSKWMPWECGYFDGIKSKVAILPVKQYSSSDDYDGHEYLSLYPYCVRTPDTNNKQTLWIHYD